MRERKKMADETGSRPKRGRASLLAALAMAAANLNFSGGKTKTSVLTKSCSTHS